jgi:DUF4097 and DUF4098 domain-containing protein YvlB
MRSRFLLATVALFASAGAYAATPVVDQLTRELTIEPTATVWLNNPYGSIDVIGSDDDKMSITIQRQITATDDASLHDAKNAVVFTFEGDQRVRVIKTRFPEPHDPRWVAVCNYYVRVPRTVNVKVAAKAMDHVRLMQIAGSVTVSAFSGTIILSNVTGSSAVDSVNGRIIYDYAQRPTADAQVQVINADVDVYVPRESSFNWVAQSLLGDLLTSFTNMHGLFQGKVFRGRIGTGNAPTLTTTTVAGRVTLLARGTSPADVVRIVAVGAPSNNPNGARQVDEGRSPVGSMSVVGPEIPPARKFQVPIIYQQNWEFVSNAMDVAVGEVHGNAHVQTGVGAVDLGVVSGNCAVDSGGGPLKFRDLMGPMDVHTDAGDVTVTVARQGGSASTDGGIVHVNWAGGPMTLRSGGGDITVGQTMAPVDAGTRSGDISLTVSPMLKTDRILAKTAQGNITLVVSPGFAADIDATLVTDDADTNRIRSDFNLTVHRETANGKTRLRATGKINGGGERVELYAEDGSIIISSQVITPVTPPRGR